MLKIKIDLHFCADECCEEKFNHTKSAMFSIGGQIFKSQRIKADTDAVLLMMCDGA